MCEVYNDRSGFQNGQTDIFIMSQKELLIWAVLKGEEVNLNLGWGFQAKRLLMSSFYNVFK